jgi:ABC-type nitrate/sulfonate/bicarbonate transport system substrate-binding protein
MNDTVVRVVSSIVVAGSLLGLSSARADGLSLAVADGPVSLLIYVAQAEDYFRREGVVVQTKECSSGRACFQLLSEGSVDIATGAELLVTLNRTKRPELAIIATICTSSHQIKLVARRSGGIVIPKQLVNKRVGTVAGTSAQYFLDSWLLFHEIDPKQVSVVMFAPDQLVAALQRREVDAIAIWEPLASAALAALADDGLAMRNPRVYTQHFSLMTERRTIGARDADLGKFIRALIRAQDLIATDPSKARSILRARPGIDPSLAEVSLKENDYRLRLDQTLLTTMSSQTRWAVREGYIDSRAKTDAAAEAVEPSLLRQAAPTAVTLTH